MVPSLSSSNRSLNKSRMTRPVIYINTIHFIVESDAFSDIRSYFMKPWGSVCFLNTSQVVVTIITFLAISSNKEFTAGAFIYFPNPFCILVIIDCYPVFSQVFSVVGGICFYRLDTTLKILNKQRSLKMKFHL